MAFVLIDEEEETPKGNFRLIQDEEQPQEEPDFSSRVGTGIGSSVIGAGQGLLDLAALPSLGLYPLERLLGYSDDADKNPNLPGRETVLNTQGEILDKLNRGETPTFSELMFLGDDDVIDNNRGTGTSLAASRNFQELVPQTGDIQEGSRRITRSLPFLAGGPGTFLNALLSEGAGFGAKKAVQGLGGSESAADWADLGAGLITGLGAGALSRAPASSRIPAALEQEGTLFSKAEIQGGRRLLDRNIQAIEQDAIQSWNENASQLSKKTFNEFPEFQSSQIAEDVIRGNESSLLNQISTIANESDAWKSIQNSIGQAFEREANIYRPLYQQVRQSSQGITHSAKPTMQAAENGLTRLQQIETQAPGYQAAENTLRTVLRDVGTRGTTFEMRELERQGLAQLSGAPINQKVPVSNLIELKTRLNDIKNYDTLSPSIRDQVLEPVLKALRQDIREGLSQAPQIEKAFNQAENQYARTAQRFNNDSIQKLRNSEAPEAVSNAFTRPSNVEALKNVLNPQEFKVAERQIVEQLLRQNTENARRGLDQIGRHISPSARNIARETIDLGDNLTSVGQRQILQRRLLNDVQSSLSNGTRPELLLNTMKTPEGYNIAKQTFNSSAKGREIFKTAERQFMADVFDSVIGENGRIDWQKASTIFTDPQVMKVVKDIGGANSVAFLQRLSGYGYNFGRNLEQFASKNPSWTQSLLGNLSSPAKTLLAGVTGSYFGIPGLLTGIGSAQLLNAVMLKALSKPGIQQILRTLGTTQNYNRTDLLSLMTRLNKSLSDEEDDGIFREPPI